MLFISRLNVVLLGQSAEQTFLLAENFFGEKKYEEAIPLYNRVVFFDDSLRAECFYKLGMSYLYLADFPEAEQYLEFASQSEENDSIRSFILMDKAFLYILSERYGLAQLELTGITDSCVQLFFNPYHALMGLCLMGQHRYDECKSYLKLILPETQHQKLDSLIRIAKKWDRKKTGIAFISSIILPGSGQFLYGNFKESINSLMLDSGLITLMYLVYIEYGFLDATLSVLPWLGRYYLGGAIKAESIAIQKKEEIHKKIFYETILLVKSAFIDFGEQN